MTTVYVSFLDGEDQASTRMDHVPTSRFEATLHLTSNAEWMAVTIPSTIKTG